jgi:hypothetical protein
MTEHPSSPRISRRSLLRGGAAAAAAVVGLPLASCTAGPDDTSATRSLVDRRLPRHHHQPRGLPPHVKRHPHRKARPLRGHRAPMTQSECFAAGRIGGSAPWPAATAHAGLSGRSFKASYAW